MAYFRNWPEIIKVGKQDVHVMLILSRLSLNENDAMLPRFLVGFSECFSDHEIVGPFPLSVIRELAAEDAEQARQAGFQWDGMFHMLNDLGVPYISFQVPVDSGPIDLIPKSQRFPQEWEMARHLKQGDVFEWKGSRLVVLSNECGSQPDPDAYHGIEAAPETAIVLDL